MWVRKARRGCVTRNAKMFTLTFKVEKDGTKKNSVGRTLALIALGFSTRLESPIIHIRMKHSFGRIQANQFIKLNLSYSVVAKWVKKLERFFELALLCKL